jgi:starch-binding outer membrane protein, SusD/RagB family
LNTLRANRGLGAVADTGSVLLDRILNERRVELAFEGNRWFDLKRLGRDITKPVAGGTPTVPYTDFRILCRIPVEQVAINPAITQNPGY